MVPNIGTWAVRIVSERKLREFAERIERAKSSLRSWKTAVKSSSWKDPAELKQTFGTADFVGDKTIFDLAGNKFRLIAFVHYGRQIVYVKHVLTHGI
jgi:mRNA interferase HigB